MENKFDRIIDYMKKHQIKSVVYISLILIIFFALLMFLSYINIVMPFPIMGIFAGLILIVALATGFVFSWTA